MTARGGQVLRLHVDALRDGSAVAELPPRLTAFLAELRVLNHVPFEYLVPDADLLPEESIRFFFLDRTWTDRLVDGALSLGKTGTRDALHHETHDELVRTRLDAHEPLVRPLARGVMDAAAVPRAGDEPAGEITGMLLRSRAVAGWPAMDVRAYDTVLPEGTSAEDGLPHQLRTLRITRLSGPVLLALFDGVPRLVVCEEPPAGVQLGVARTPQDLPGVERREPDGDALPGDLLPVPMGADGRTVDIIALRRALHVERRDHTPQMVPQRGAADLAVQLLSPPYRQRFGGAA